MVYRRGLDRILNGIGRSSGFGLKQRWESAGSTDHRILIPVGFPESSQ